MVFTVKNVSPVIGAMLYKILNVMVNSLFLMMVESKLFFLLHLIELHSL